MKHYIENVVLKEDDDNKKELKIGFINSKEELIWYKLS